MRALIQRVSFAKVKVNQEILGQIGPGLLIFLGVGISDNCEIAAWMAAKAARLRIFADPAGKMNLSVMDVRGSILVISQFTLYGDARHGHRPGFDLAAPPETAEPLYEEFCRQLASMGILVQTGQFAASMKVELENDGPVTIWLESKEKSPEAIK
jgi:D-aminoacyl-tRNA deacylase